MTEEVRCKNCQAVIDPANVDWQRELATCTQCGRLVDLRKARASAPNAEQAAERVRARASLALPVGMTVETGARLVIRRRWLRAKHWFLLMLFTAAGGTVAYLWSTVGASAWVVIGTMFVLSWYYNVITMFVNSTTVTADSGGVVVKNGPLPSIFARGASVEKANLEQLYAAKYGARFAVYAKQKSGKIQPLVVLLTTAEQALFIEREVERVLGLVDRPVPGELDDIDLALIVQGKEPAGAASGKAVAFLVPVLIAGAIGLFFLMASTEVSGRLQASGALGTWAFEPDDCSSGQTEGFGGVVLTSSKHPDRVLRVINDPVRGKLVVVASPGQPNQVLGADACPLFVVNVVRGDTNINDVWAMDGNVQLHCKELTGEATFEGCH